MASAARQPCGLLRDLLEPDPEPDPDPEIVRGTISNGIGFGIGFGIDSQISRRSTGASVHAEVQLVGDDFPAAEDGAAYANFGRSRAGEWRPHHDEGRCHPEHIGGLGPYTVDEELDAR